MKLNPVDMVPAMGVAAVVWGGASAVTSLTGLDVQNPEVLKALTTYSAGAAAVGTTLVSAKIRTKFTKVATKASEDLNIDPKIGRALASGPIGILKVGLQMALQKSDPAASATTPKQGFSMRSIIQEAMANSQQSTKGKEDVQPKVTDSPDIDADATPRP